jgi:uncharacterized membrane protein
MDKAGGGKSRSAQKGGTIVIAYFLSKGIILKEFLKEFLNTTFGYTLRQMEAWLSPLLAQLMAWLALPEHGLSTVFTIAFISATLLPMGSEPAVFGLIKLNP